MRTSYTPGACGRYVVLSVSRDSGRPTKSRPPCGNWACPHCAAEKRQAIADHLRHVATEGVRWCYCVATSDSEDARVRDRLRSGHHEHLRVARADDRTQTYIIHPPPASVAAPRGRLVGAEAAIDLLLRRALRPPATRGRVIRVTWSRGWRPVPAQSRGRLIARTADELQVDAAFSAAAERAEAETGYRPALGVDLPRGGLLTPSMWARILLEEWSRTYES